MKLYWRYKKDGAWTWKAALTRQIQCPDCGLPGVIDLDGEEE